jgi:hypothetical protein
MVSINDKIGIVVCEQDKTDTYLCWYFGRVTNVPDSGVCIRFGHGDKDNSVLWDLRNHVQNYDANVTFQDLLDSFNEQNKCVAWTTTCIPSKRSQRIRDINDDEIFKLADALKVEVPRDNAYSAFKVLMKNSLVVTRDAHAAADPQAKKKRKATNLTEDVSDDHISKKLKLFEERFVAMQASSKNMLDKLVELENENKEITAKYTRLNKQIKIQSKEHETSILNLKTTNKFEFLTRNNLTASQQKLFRNHKVNLDKIVYFSKVGKKTEQRRKACFRIFKFDTYAELSPLCSSKTMVNGYFESAKDAKLVPVGIMEIVPNIHKLDFSAAHKVWKTYSTCHECAFSTELKFIPSGTHQNIPENGSKCIKYLWNHCPLCINGTVENINNEYNFGICETCHNCLRMHGNHAYSDGVGGDNRAMFVIPIMFRMPTVNIQKISWSFVSSDEKYVGPDTLLQITIPGFTQNINIILEEDGSEHSSEKEDKEIERFKHIVNEFDNTKTNMLSLRYCPHGRYRDVCDTPYNPCKATRMLVIRAWIIWFIKRIVSQKKLPRIMIGYMFYSAKNKHLERAEKEFKDNKNVLVFKTNTIPQVNVSSPIDWRYGLTPNEGVIFEHLTSNSTYSGVVKTSLKDIVPELFPKDNDI